VRKTRSARIASLIPSGTDIACDLGLSKYLVGISHGCDHPSTRGLPILTESRIPENLSPRAIDNAVRDAINSDANTSLYLCNRELLCKLQPDIVLTQAICDVCAVNAGTTARDLPPSAELINLSATSFSGLWNDLRNIARTASTQLPDIEARAENLITRLQARLQKIEAAVKDLPRPRVLVLEWSDPPFAGGHWVPEIIERAGGTHLLGNIGEPASRISWDEIQDADPDVILLAPCGYDLQETIEQAQALREYSAFANLRALKTGNVWATNATHLFSRCTPASVRAVEVVAGVLHSEVWKNLNASEISKIAFMING
jgi:iron complex transport system substrate-binding protein